MIQTANEEMRADQLARKQEEERQLAGQKFEFEPRHLPWCQRFTMAKLSPEMLEDLANNDLIPKKWAQDLPKGPSPLLQMVLKEILDGKEESEAIQQRFQEHNFEFVFDPARGEVRAVFALCDRLNPFGNCPHFSPREPKESV
jgi:hypothetical protein